MPEFTIVGAGPGNRALMSQAAVNAVLESEVLIGGLRNLEAFPEATAQKMQIKDNLDAVVERIKKDAEEKRVVVLASGDPFFFGIGSYLVKKLPHFQIHSIGGISSLSYLAGKVGLKIENIVPVSVHAGQADIPSLLYRHEFVGLFTGRKPESTLKELALKGFQDWQVIAGENLSYEDEKISKSTVGRLQENAFSDLTVMILIKPESISFPISRYTGISDEEFIRGQTPMTKEEIRALSIRKLQLTEKSYILDVGAGTGSVSVEMALCAPKGRVYAIEKEESALRLLRENKEKFHCYNMEIIMGDALSVLQNDDIYCDRAFIGGTGGQMNQILSILGERNPIRVVINTITIENTYEALKALQINGFNKIECMQVAISKSRQAGDKHMMIANNPVTILCGEKGEIL